MKHLASAEDQKFRLEVESLRVRPEEFDHAAHVRLAYAYLCDGSTEEASARLKNTLLAFLGHLGSDSSKYHETITRAWVMAVDHFMDLSAPCASYEEFVGFNPRLLDSRIMLTHYSARALLSVEARQKFIAPDIQPIPPPRSE